MGDAGGNDALYLRCQIDLTERLIGRGMHRKRRPQVIGFCATHGQEVANQRLAGVVRYVDEQAFEAKIVQRTGETPTQMIQRVTQVALMTVFKDVAAFTNFISNYAAASPSQLRQKIANQPKRGK